MAAGAALAVGVGAAGVALFLPRREDLDEPSAGAVAVAQAKTDATQRSMLTRRSPVTGPW